MLESLGQNRWTIDSGSDDTVDPIVYANDVVKPQLEPQSLQQLRNAARLRGVVHVAGMPDLHVGYGVPVGSNLVMDADEGLISAGAVGMDINCGMRLLSSDVLSDSVDRSTVKSFARQISKVIPLGIGTTSPHQDELSSEIEDVLVKGVPHLKSLGYAREDDLRRIQDGGSFDGADPSKLPEDAWDRLDQLGTLGGGNHFIEVDEIDEIYAPTEAEAYGLKEGRLSVMIHTGSRGLGHQICTDYSGRMLEASPRFELEFPDDQLAAAPIQSSLGHEYYGAMAAAANIAYANRQVIAYDIRQLFENLVGTQSDALRTVYDITHNLARFETVDDRDVLTHRKGAIRSLPPGHPDNPEAYREVGHPIIVPGNMATGSYVLRATPAARETFHTVNHGAGRTMSRRQAKRTLTPKALKKRMEDIVLLGTAYDDLLDEAPMAYKELDPVIETLTEIGLVEKVARLKPRAVIKGD